MPFWVLNQDLVVIIMTWVSERRVQGGCSQALNLFQWLELKWFILFSTSMVSKVRAIEFVKLFLPSDFHCAPAIQLATFPRTLKLRLAVERWGRLLLSRLGSARFGCHPFTLLYFLSYHIFLASTLPPIRKDYTWKGEPGLIMIQELCQFLGKERF
jgi:hypothetical protein